MTTVGRVGQLQFFLLRFKRDELLNIISIRALYTAFFQYKKQHKSNCVHSVFTHGMDGSSDVGSWNMEVVPPNLKHTQKAKQCTVKL